jgi:acyl dehydratase
MTELDLGSYGPVTRTDIVRYAGASGDFLPLHHDEEAAKAAGFPSVFAMGMLSAGLLAASATNLLGTDAVRRYRIRFREQVWPGDVLRFSAVVTQVGETTPEGTLVTLDLTCRRETGGAAITGEADFLLSPAGLSLLSIPAIAV